MFSPFVLLHAFSLSVKQKTREPLVLFGVENKGVVEKKLNPQKLLNFSQFCYWILDKLLPINNHDLSVFEDSRHQLVLESVVGQVEHGV